MSRKQGTIKWFNATKGYGFIVPADGGKDVFLHAKSLQKSGIDSVKDGQKISYEIGYHDNKEDARNISLE